MGEPVRWVTVRLLGPVDASVGARPVPLSGGGRAVLALLTLADGATVPPADVVDALWGETPPASAPLRAHALVTQLGRCLHRAGTAHEIASLVVWLASPGATYATGSSFVVDGGLMLKAADQSAG